METTLNVLNVSVIEPRLKHPTIFARFDELNEGEEFEALRDISTGEELLVDYGTIAEGLSDYESVHK